jgi:peptide-methionine (R)-S-oxide reductase
MKKYRKNLDVISKLSQEQYRVTQLAATEPPGSGEHLYNKRRGVYVDVVSGEPLFGSGDKFDPGTGWPSFAKPIDPANITERPDAREGGTEVRSAHGDSHLGHVFPDGPADLGGLRYCINSAALRFIPYDEMEGEGYGAYRDHLEGAHD